MTVNLMKKNVDLLIIWVDRLVCFLRSFISWRRLEVSGISIRIITSQPLLSAMVCWLPHCAKYCIYNSNRGVSALGTSIRGNGESGCHYIQWWHNFFHKVTLNLHHEGVRTYRQSDFSYTRTAVAAWGWDEEWVLITGGGDYEDGGQKNGGKKNCKYSNQTIKKLIRRVKRSLFHKYSITYFTCVLWFHACLLQDLLTVQVLFLAWLHTVSFLHGIKWCGLLFPIIPCLDYLSRATTCPYFDTI